MFVSWRELWIEEEKKCRYEVAMNASGCASAYQFVLLYDERVSMT